MYKYVNCGQAQHSIKCTFHPWKVITVVAKLKPIFPVKVTLLKLPHGCSEA